MRKLCALVFHYSLNGLLADEGTDYFRFCFELLDEGGGASDDDVSYVWAARDGRCVGRLSLQEVSDLNERTALHDRLTGDGCPGRAEKGPAPPGIRLEDNLPAGVDITIKI